LGETAQRHPGSLEVVVPLLDRERLGELRLGLGRIAAGGVEHPFEDQADREHEVEPVLPALLDAEARRANRDLGVVAQQPERALEHRRETHLARRSGGRCDPVPLVPLLLRPLDLAAHPRAERSREQGARAADRRQALAVRVEKRPGLFPGCEVLAPDVPVHPEVGADQQPALAGVAVAGSSELEIRIERGLEVGLLLDSALDRRDLRISLDAVPDLAGNVREVPGVPGGDLVRLPGGGEPLSGELADRLQQAEALALRIELYEPFLDQRLELVEARPARLGADGLDVGERAASGEDGEAAEQLLLALAEEGVAPVDRRAQRLLPLGTVAGARDEDVERVVEPPEQGLGREDTQPGGRELEGERQPVEPPAELFDDLRVLGGQLERRPRPPRAFREQRDCRVRPKGGELVLVLGSDPQRSPARGQHAQFRAALDQPGHGGSRVHYLLEVVEKQ
jgi:hypothetical protein